LNHSPKPGLLSLALSVLGALGIALGSAMGSTGWEPWWQAVQQGGVDPVSWQIVWDIRLPRSLGAWVGGALLGLAGALAQGLFRNPLADPYLLGSASGASLGVAIFLSLFGGSVMAMGWLVKVGMTGAAFAGAVLAVMLTLVLARGVQQTLRLLLAGVVVGVVLGAITSFLNLWRPEVWQGMQGFMLGSTGFIGWTACLLMCGVLLLCSALAVVMARVLDALTLGENTARSLGVPLAQARVWLIAVIALATGTAVAQMGLIAFVGLAAPHVVRAMVRATHRWTVVLAALTGGLLLLLADLLARGLIAPQEMPVGVLTAVLGGGYLLWRMSRMSSVGGRS
jgi:iron complex transport system permease protein